MAREWHAVFSAVAPAEQTAWSPPDHLQDISRSWSADRGTVLWQGVVDLVGSFPGFAPWGSQAEAVHLTVTDTYLLVEEATEFGFGLPIGWLSAAQSATGQEPVSLDAGHRLRISYRDQRAVRQFALRARGGRFGSKAARLAEQLRLVFARMGLAGVTTAGNGLPATLQLTIGWDEFAKHEHEPVVWSGRAMMPTGTGDTAAVSEIWLTDHSLIWSTQGRGDIHRIALDVVVGVTPADVPGGEAVPALYWTVAGPGPRQTDVLMVFSHSGGEASGQLERNVLLTLLTQRGIEGIAATLPPQPWWQPIDMARAAGIASPPALPGSENTVANEPRDGAVVPAPAAAITSIRQAVGERGPHLPTSTPLPWGDRVERVTPASAESRLAEARAVEASLPTPATPRIWPPVSATATAPMPATDPATMLVRRPPCRMPITDEFPAVPDESPTDDPAPKYPTQAHDRAMASGPCPRPTIEITFRQSPPLASLPTFGHRGAQWTVGATTPTNEAAAGDGARTAAPGTAGARRAAAMTDEAETRVSADSPLARVTMPATIEQEPAEMARPTAKTALPSGRPVMAASPGRADDGPRERAMRDQMLAAMAEIDQTLAGTLAALRSVERDATEAINCRSANGPLADALAALDAAVVRRALSRSAAETHRIALTRTADTNERLRALIDLRRRGYLTAEEMAGRRDALLGRGGTT